MSENIFFPEGKKILIGKEEFTIMPFVLKNRVKAVRVIVDVLKDVMANGDIKDTDSMAQVADVLIMSAGDRLVEVYELIIDKSREWLENNIRIVDELVIIEAVLEVNDINFLVQKVRALIPQVKKVTE